MSLLVQGGIGSLRVYTFRVSDQEMIGYSNSEAEFYQRGMYGSISHADAAYLIQEFRQDTPLIRISPPEGTKCIVTNLT